MSTVGAKTMPFEAKTMTLESEIAHVLSATWPDRTPTSISVPVDLSGGRGVFSRVYSVGLDWPDSDTGSGSDRASASQEAEGIHHRDATTPGTVAIKLPPMGPNRQAAITIGAFERESLAYTNLLDAPLPLTVPRCFGVIRHEDGASSFVIEDLSKGRFQDQVSGLDKADSVCVADALGRWHHPAHNSPRLKVAQSLGLRGPTTKTLSLTGMTAGLQTLSSRWTHVLSQAQIETFRRLVDSREFAVQRFENLEPSLCHGDARADNFVFDHQGSRFVLLDWQQIGCQAAEADLAWFCATSLEPDQRRSIERELVQTFALSANCTAAESWDRYRTSLVLPGLAVLFLAQRQVDSDYTEQFVAISLQRIATAISDHELA